MGGLTQERLWELRKQIVLGSLYTSDYRNTLDFEEHSVQDFFDGYYDFLDEIAIEYNTVNETNLPPEVFDDPERLYEWYNCFDEEPFKEEE